MLYSTTLVASISTDDLKKDLMNVTDDTSKIRLLNKLAYQYYWEYKYDSCLHYALIALNLLEPICKYEQTQLNASFRNKCITYKAQSLANYARGIKNRNSQEALDTLYNAIELIKQTANKLEEGRIYESIGVIHDFNGENKLALETHILSLAAYKAAGAENETALQLTNVAITHRNMGNYGDAMEYMIESLNLSKKLNDSTSMVEALLAMGFTYMYVEKWEEALEVQQEALEIYTKLNDSLGIARIYNDMGVTNMSSGNFEKALELHKAALDIRLSSTDYYYTYASYSYIGEIYEKLNNYTDAIRVYEAGKKYAQLSGMKISEIYSFLNTGSAYFKSGDYEISMEQYKTALELSAKIEEGSSEAIASLNIAKIYLRRDQPRESLNWLQRAEKAALKSNNTYLESIYQNIADSYSKIGDHQNAYLNFMKYCEVKDSLAAAENLEKLTTLVNRLEFENKKKLQDENHKKMMQIKQTEVDRQKVVKNFSLFGAFVILVLAIIVFIRFMEKKRLNTKLNATLRNLKATQSQLVHAEKMATLGELTAGVAHEIQNPLNFIKNFSEVNADLIEELKEEMDNGDKQGINAILDDISSNEKKITEHSNRADSIVKGMLQHSRKGSKDKQPTDINKLADEYLRLAYHGLRAKNKSFNADFRLDSDENLPEIEIIPQDIGRVFLNLINNAFYACSEKARKNTKDYKPEVVVATRQLNNKIEISIKDNGDGIPEEFKDKIFQPFFTTKPTGEGTGLGLSLSYDIITKGHGGELKVETKEGKGLPAGQAETEFIIQLPING